ncbi:hypothetical protein [Arhodomonas sp. AD133]|uniref:hypothetical protein n=1 Tax=Arhodomonas sp. AD133 TaxID=3415009 RepID=UPI003EBA1B5C
MTSCYRPGNSQRLTNPELIDALGALARRLDVVDEACGNAFPLYARGGGTRWVPSRGGSWIGGFWAASRPTALPPDRLDTPSAPPDPSAAVIAALAMLLVAKLTPDSDRWHDRAQKQIASVIHSPFFTGCRNATAPETRGVFQGCRYRTEPQTLETVESPWGSFLLMATLAVLAGHIAPDDC